MELPRRRLLQLAAVAAALPALPRTGWSQAYPSRPIRMIVPFAPGGQLDAIARIFAQQMSERLSRQFVVENVTGGGGAPGRAVRRQDVAGGRRPRWGGTRRPGGARRLHDPDGRYRLRPHPAT